MKMPFHFSTVFYLGQGFEYRAWMDDACAFSWGRVQEDFAVDLSFMKLGPIQCLILHLSLYSNYWKM